MCRLVVFSFYTLNLIGTDWSTQLRQKRREIDQLLHKVIYNIINNPLNAHSHIHVLLIEPLSSRNMFWNITIRHYYKTLL